MQSEQQEQKQQQVYLLQPAALLLHGASSVCWRSIRCVSAAPLLRLRCLSAPLATGRSYLYSRARQVALLASTPFVTTSCRTCARVELICVTARSFFREKRLRGRRNPRWCRRAQRLSVGYSPSHINILSHHVTKSSCVDEFIVFASTLDLLIKLKDSKYKQSSLILSMDVLDPLK